MSFQFAKPASEPNPKSQREPWKVLVIDDEPDVFKVTNRILSHFTLLERPLECLFASNEEESKALLQSHPDAAICLLDVVMENKDSGLKLVKFIREELKNHKLRVILRTGQPGDVPERKVFTDYDINDYKLKTELTEDRLYTTLLGALRSYQSLLDLEEANRMKSDFLSTMSHELRTPLNGIIGMSQLIQMQEPEPDTETNSYANIIITSSYALLDIFDQILNLRRITSGKFQFELEEFDLHHMMKNLANLFSASCKSKGLHLLDPVINCPHRYLRGDQRHLTQILTHLLSNAVKFTDQGSIQFLCEDLGSDDQGKLWLQFTVIDTGCGIPPEKQSLILSSFFQVDSGLQRKVGGVGLGLTVVDQLVKVAGGVLEIESQPNLGSRFRFTYPVEVI